MNSRWCSGASASKAFFFLMAATSCGQRSGLALAESDEESGDASGGQATQADEEVGTGEVEASGGIANHLVELDGDGGSDASGGVASGGQALSEPESASKVALLNPYPHRDWLAVFSVDNQVWATSTSGEVLSWKAKDDPTENLEFSLAQLATTALTDVWAHDAADVWVVSVSGEAFHWDGQGWKRFEVGESNQLLVLRSVWGSASNDVWAVGDGGVIYHFDGQSWLAMQSGTVENLTQIQGRSGGDMLAVGCGTRLQFDGATWHNLADYYVCWQDSFPGIDNSIWVTGYWQTSGYRGGGGAARTRSFLAGTLNSTMDAVSGTAWLTPSGKFISIQNERLSIVYTNQEGTDVSTDVYEAPTPFADLWGDKRWTWGVGEAP